MTRRLIIILSVQCFLFSLGGEAQEKSPTLSENFKNPFLSPLIIKPLEPPVVHKEVVVVKKTLKPVQKIVKPRVVDIASLKLSLEGMVWGDVHPQAIINGQIVGLGDFIKGAKVVLITKRGVVVMYEGVKAVLTVDKKI